MPATPHSARVFSAPRLMKVAWRYEPYRTVEVQEWRGDTLVNTWTYHPDRGWQFTA